jgi:mitotic spindle assembly checkpoint protein MAD1
LAHASLERQLGALTTTKNDLEKKLREKDVVIDRVEKDRRWLAERENKELEQKERERIEWDKAKVSSRIIAFTTCYEPWNCIATVRQ